MYVYGKNGLKKIVRVAHCAHSPSPYTDKIIFMLLQESFMLRETRRSSYTL